MLLTRWKLMAGVLGVSIGGLAAAASQCPKLDKSKGRQPEAPVTAEAPKLPPAGAPSSAPKLPDLPAPAPAAPQLTPAGVTPPAPAGEKVVLPPAPATAPGLPSLPDFPSPTEPKAVKPEEKALPAALTLPIPDAKPAVEPTKTTTPVPATPPMTPPKPVAEAPKAAPANDLLPPAVTAAPSKPIASPPLDNFAPPVTNAATPGKPAAQPVMPIGGTTQPPALSGAAVESPKPLPTEQPPVLDVPPSKPTPAPGTEAGTMKVGAMKYRIVLRVGEGEPTFEVKSGDDLVLKVACEKVDIKSPEKGAGLSAVTARGKVRFAGFGVEGTCEELSFMAGTGEVSMAGDVKVQMKDKLGRVESELTTATLKYKIDANAVGAAIKP